MQRVGIIGLGPIGKHFVKKLLEKGYPLIVMDQDAAQLREPVALGAQTAGSPGEVAEKSDVVLLCLPGSRAVDAVMLGECGVLAKLREGLVIVDTGTSSPETDIRYERLCDEKKARFLEAPVTWRGPGLILMAGGKEAYYEAAREVLEVISYKVKRVGEIGRGQVLKAANQMYFSNLTAVNAELIDFADSCGFGREELVDFLEFHLPERMFGDDFSRISGTTELNYKDLLYAFEIAHDTQAYIPITQVVHGIFKEGVAHGEGKWDQTGIINTYRRSRQKK